MPSLRLYEIDELMLEDDELDVIQLRRKLRKEQKEKSSNIKFIKPKDYETDINNGSDRISTDSNKW